MKIYKSIKNLINTNPDLGRYVCEIFHPFNEVELFDLIGGDVNEIENISDLDKVPTLSPGISLSQSKSMYDICEWVLDDTYVMILLVTTNAGGNVYFIPRKIALQHKNILDSIF